MSEENAKTEPAAAAKRRSLFGELKRIFGVIVRIVISTAGVGIALLVLSQIALDTLHPTIDIKPVSVPHALDKAGYKPDVVSRKLADELVRIQNAAPTGHRRRTLYFDRPPLDLTMPGLGFSVSSISSYIKAFFSLEEVILCDITGDKNQFVMIIRDRKTQRSQTVDTVQGNNLDDLINAAAKKILRLSDPYVLASYLRATDPGQAKLLLRDVIAGGDEEDVAWGYGMWGVIVKLGGDIDGGIRYYQTAVDAFRAIPWYRRWFLSEDVVATAYVNMAIAYRDKNNPAESTRYAQQAAHLGLDTAETLLGERYLEPYGVERDPRAAEMWLRRGAAQGRAKANYQLALLYLADPTNAGDGIRPNRLEGIARLRNAATRGDAAAEARLGSEYLSGKNLPRDVAEATYWLRLAAAKGDTDAEKLLDDLAQQGGCEGKC